MRRRHTKGVFVWEECAKGVCVLVWGNRANEGTSMERRHKMQKVWARGRV